MSARVDECDRALGLAAAGCEWTAGRVSVDAMTLVVEDDPANQFLVRAVLESAGYHVEAASTAAEAISCLTIGSPVLILMDGQLPGQDGLSLTRLLKNRPETASIPVVALTAAAMPGDRENAFAAGCAGYFAKPIDVHTFPSRVAGFLAAARAG